MGRLPRSSSWSHSSDVTVITGPQIRGTGGTLVRAEDGKLRAGSARISIELQHRGERFRGCQNLCESEDRRLQAEDISDVSHSHPMGGTKVSRSDNSAHREETLWNKGYPSL